MIRDREMTPEAASAISTQLFRYYDINADVLTGYSEYGDGSLRIYYEVESGVTYSFVRARIFSHTVEDLYLIAPDGELIEPTTTREEQETR